MFNVSNSCNGHRLGDPVPIWLSWSTSKCPLLPPQNKNSLKVSKYVKPVNEKVKKYARILYARNAPCIFLMRLEQQKLRTELILRESRSLPPDLD